MSERQLTKHPSSREQAYLSSTHETFWNRRVYSRMFLTVRCFVSSLKKTSQLDVKQLSVEQLDVELCGLTLISNLSSN